ncbi:MAG: TolC family protein [Muribaculaceae bacterium]|nr:TolC family protein [Muribaculaceae bacterium]
MKTYSRILLSLALAGACYGHINGDIYTEALSKIEANSLRLKALGATRDADIEATRAGQTLANPELELGYLWGADGGPDRKDIGLSQEFDMETLTGAKGRVAQAQRSEAESIYAEARREVLLEAKLALIELIGCQSAENLARERVRLVKGMAEAAVRLNELGELSLIDLNKAKLVQAEADNTLRMAHIATVKAQRAVDALNGGQPLEFGYSEFPIIMLPSDFDDWVMGALNSDAAILAMQSSMEVSEREVSLAKAGNLPSFTLGYSGEFIEGGTLNGVTLGVTLPLWANRGAVRAAKARQNALRAAYDDTLLAKREELHSLFDEVNSLLQLERAYIEATNVSDNTALLKRAFEAGELSLHDYLDQSSYRYDVAERLLAIRHDLAVAACRLEANRL